MTLDELSEIVALASVDDGYWRANRDLFYDRLEDSKYATRVTPGEFRQLVKDNGLWCREPSGHSRDMAWFSGTNARTVHPWHTLARFSRADVRTVQRWITGRKLVPRVVVDMLRLRQPLRRIDPDAYDRSMFLTYDEMVARYEMVDRPDEHRPLQAAE
jgi:hypothetical protein